MKVRFNLRNTYSYLTELPSRAVEFVSNKKLELAEKKIARNFELHNRTSQCETADVIYPMREAIANFARKNGVKIDVFDSRTPIVINGITSFHADKNAARNIKIRVQDIKGRGNDNAAVLDGDTSRIIPRERVRRYIVNVPGEDTQIARQVKSTSEDVFLKYFLRKVDYLVQEVVNSRR